MESLVCHRVLYRQHQQSWHHSQLSTSSPQPQDKPTCPSSTRDCQTLLLMQELWVGGQSLATRATPGASSAVLPQAN